MAGKYFVAFPYPNKYSNWTVINWRIHDREFIIPAGYDDDNCPIPSIRKIGYSGTTHNFTCILAKFAQYNDYNKWNDTTTCAFTDDTLGESAVFSRAAKNFIGHVVYVTVGSYGVDGKVSLGESVLSAFGALCKHKITIDGVLNNEYYESVTVKSGTTGVLKLDGGVNYAINLPSALYCAAFPSYDSSKYERVAVVGDIGQSEDNARWVFEATKDLELTTQLASKFTVSFNANGGSGIHSNQSFVTGTSQSILANTFTRDKYAFAGWNTSADGTGFDYNDKADGNTILTNVGGTAGSTVVLYAQWEYAAFNITVSKSYVGGAGGEQEDVGTLTLVDTDSNETVATESNGSLYYEGYPGVKYRLVCDLVNSKPDVLWSPTGVFNDGAYSSVYEFTPTSGNVLTKIYRFTKKSLFTFSISCDPNACTAAVTSPVEADEDGKYVYGRDIEITATPDSGYEAIRAQGTSGRSFESFANNKLVYPNLTGNDALTIYFSKTKYEASVGIDAASASAIQSVMIKNGDNEWSSTGTEEYYVDDSLTLTAEVANGYSFDGWYVDGVRVSTNSTYSYQGIGTKTFVAKAKVAVSLTAEGRDNGGTVPETSPAVAPTGVTDGYVTLGESFGYEIELNGWIFNSWFDASDTDRQNPLLFGPSGTITPTAALSIVADVTSAIIQNTITVVMEDDELAPGQTEHADISQAGVVSTVPSADRGGWIVADGCYKFGFDGTKNITFKALETIDDGDPESSDYAFVRFADSNYNTIDVNPEFQLLTSTKTIRAMYAKGGTRSVTLSYGTADGITGDRTMGSFEFTSVEDSFISADGSTATVDRGTTIGILVKPKNGYKFMGWYSQETVGGDPYRTGTSVNLVVSTNRNLYAYFKQDPNAVYVWERSGDNKSFEWRSKIYVLARPANMSCCRVDTEGYPLVELDVDMFSAPDSSPTEKVALTNVISQTARRLPIRRMERYLQVCMKNDREVDAVMVGTNMKELS